MIKRVFLILMLAAIPTFFLGETWAVFEDYSEEEINILTGQMKTIEVDMPTKLVISNPEIVDINRVTDKEITLLGKAKGSTHLFIWDRAGERAIKVWVVLEDVADIKKRADRLISELDLEDVSTHVNEQESKVVVSGTVNEASQKEQLDSVFAPFKDKLIDLVKVKEDQPSVLIDVQILELSVTDLSDLGVSWFTSIQFREEPYLAAAATTGVTTTLNKVAKLDKLLRLSSSNWSRDAVTAKLNLLVSEGRGRILSRPKLVCLSGKTASILVGGEVPVITGRTTGTAGTTSSVEYKEYGIKLNIKPTVKETNEINTTLTTEVSDLDWANAVTIDGNKLPAFSKRTATSELYLKEGQTIFLAGLIKNKDTKTLSKFPWFSSVPVLGELFKSTRFELGQTELVISLTPTIMRPASSIQAPAAKDGPVFDTSFGRLSSLPASTVRYIRSIQERVYVGLIYPTQARRERLEGKVLLNLHILSDGQLLQAIIKESSGNNILDSAALKSVKRTSPYPPFPPALGLKELWIEVPIVYKLD